LIGLIFWWMLSGRIEVVRLGGYGILLVVVTIWGEKKIVIVQVTIKMGSFITTFRRQCMW